MKEIRRYYVQENKRNPLTRIHSVNERIMVSITHHLTHFCESEVGFAKALVH